MSIFEKIGEKLSGAGQGVAQQVKNFADVARLNSIISEKEKQIAQLYIEIGQAYECFLLGKHTVERVCSGLSPLRRDRLWC